MTAVAEPPVEEVPAAEPPRPRAERPDVRKQGENAQSAAWGDPHHAAAYEEEIARDADQIWSDVEAGAKLTVEILARLYPLLRRPLHPGHVIATSAAKGKPYESDGARSVQVLIDRMNNVLRPWNWEDRVEYHKEGSLAEVTVTIIGEHGPLVRRTSWGGMDRANTAGNLRKASYTNAAKLAFARIGPGHEIYTQSIDYDPDLLPGAIEDQNRAPAIVREQPTARVVQPPALEHPTATIKRLLAIEDDLAPLREKADEGMRIVGAGEEQRARELDRASMHGKAALEELVARVNSAINDMAEAEPS